ncbi:MAG: YodL domain-containing protein, partial [Lachnospiraceae bacterium]|nr:YodL domain-containing protein [Ruminococcus sp.]MCM1276871.1 YodL domain-containing protein [Lachnospiraceae bacterium]
SAPANPNIIGNTPYNQLGGKGQLEFYTNLKNRHADNIAVQLNADGVRFSGLRKGEVTTITINKADIQRYEAAVEKVKQSYRRNDAPDRGNNPQNFRSAEPSYDNASNYPNFENYRQPSAPTNPNIIGNTPYNQLGGKGQLEFYTNLKNRHADNIAAQLNADGVRFSGLRKGDVTTITINKADISRYEAAVEKVKQSYRRNDVQDRGYPQQNSAPQYQSNFQEPYDNAPTNPNVIGNTPYNQLGGKDQLQYYTNLKNRHADNVAKQLDEDGIRFSGLRKGTVTTITINKADIPRYEEAVEKVKQTYERLNNPAGQIPETLFREQVPKPKSAEPPRTEIPETRMDEPENFRSVPIITQSFMEAKQSGNFGAWKDSVAASQACMRFIEDNIRAAYEGRDLENFVRQLDEKFGIDRAMYLVAATIQLKNQDGRFTNAVKQRAAQYSFDSDKMRLNFLTERHPVMINHLYQQMMEMERDLRLNPHQQDEKLSANFDGKLLYSSERVKLSDDFRGIPETKYYKSSANEFFIPDIGWLDNDAYERECKNSKLTGKEFYERVTRINANCIDGTGLVGQMDMSRAEYDAMNERTYSPKNAEALRSALDKLDERRNAANIPEKTTEYFAVRQMSEKKFAVCSISADGLVTTVKPNISSITEAKKAMLEIFERKKDSVKVEFVHSQTLDEISAEMYKQRSREELPDAVYRITLNPDKQAADTHVLQEYVKNADDTYSAGQEIAKGDYEKCNKFLAQIFNAPKREEPVRTFEIYQVKNDDELHNIRFMPSRLLEEKPDFANYDKVYEGNAAEFRGELGDRLEAIFEKFNLDHPEDFKGHSLSISDVVVLDDNAYYVDDVGFKPLKEFIPLEVKQSRFYDELPQRLSNIAEGKISPLQDNLLKVANDALKLNVPPEIMREAAYRQNDERTDKLAESYEKMFERKHGGADPERDKPAEDRPHRKPRL